MPYLLSNSLTNIPQENRQKQKKKKVIGKAKQKVKSLLSYPVSSTIPLLKDKLSQIMSFKERKLRLFCFLFATNKTKEQSRTNAIIKTLSVYPDKACKKSSIFNLLAKIHSVLLIAAGNDGGVSCIGASTGANYTITLINKFHCSTNNNTEIE